MYIEASGLTSQDHEKWGEYCVWNKAIAQYFYTGRFQNKPVYLDINDQLIIEIGADLKIKNPVAHFKRAIKKTLSVKNLLSNHSVVAINWRNRKVEETPPFIALLAFFSYIAEKMVGDQEYVAHNYYGRLKDELDLQGYDYQALQKSYRDICTLLWPLLNEWIAAWDGEIGIPTARALDARKYVSTAISQALVREQDRNLLKKLFSEQGLAAGQRLRNMEMLSILLHWASAVPAPNSLSKLLTRVGEVRDKVVEIACSELEMWDGRLEEQNEAGEKIYSLHYLATFKDYPSPKISLFLSANINSELSQSLVFNKSSENHGLVFECPVSEVRFEWLQDFGVSTIEPYERISQGDALLSKISLESTERKQKFTRIGQPICIMAYRAEIGAYQEVSRISLGQKSLILAHDSIKDQISSLLIEIARPGYLTFNENTCSGIPEGWILFCNVQVVSIVQKDGLEALVPLHDSSVVLSGGIGLSYDTWLTSSPPEIAITVKTKNKLCIEIKQELAFDKAISPINIENTSGILFQNLATYQLPDGDYQLDVHAADIDSEFSYSTSFKLRSSNCIRIYKTSDYERLSHVFGDDETLGPVTAQRNVSRVSDKAYLSGFGISSKNSLEIDYECIELLHTALDSEDHSRDDGESRSPLLTTKSKEANSCIVRGSHVVIYHEVPPGAPSGFLVAGRCMNCGLTFWNHAQRSKKGAGRVFQIRNIGPKKTIEDSFISRLTGKVSTPPPTNDTSDVINFSLPSLNQKTSDLDIKFNLKEIFDALCYLKDGRFEKFCSLTREISPDLWFPYELIRQLSALGHIDIQYDLTSLKPKYWRVSDPCITNISEGVFIISGWQSENFISLLKSVSQQLGAEVEVEVGSNGLQIIKVLNISTADLATFASIVSEESDYPLKAEKFFAEKALTLMPPLSRVMGSLETIEMPNSNLEYLDPKTRRWKKVEGGIVSGGGYRHREFGFRYFYLDSADILSRKAIICDARLVKYFALKESLGNLVAHNPVTLEFTVPFNMDLPFLYERIAVSCSGSLPIKEGGLIKYQNIPVDIAEGLAFKLIM